MKKEKSKKVVGAAVVLSSLKKDKAKLFKLLDGKTIKNNDQLQLTVDRLKALKELRKDAEAKYDAIVEPSKIAAKKTKEATDDLFDPFWEGIDEKIKETNDVILLYSNKQDDKIKTLTIGKGGAKAFMAKAASMEVAADGLQLKGRWVATVTNKKKVPLQYMEPDMKAITQACRDGKVPPGVSWKKVKQIAI